jgi:hypothetical protein
MNISDYVAIYAAIMATAVLIWLIWQHRKYLKFDEIITREGNNTNVELYLTNKTKRPVNIRQICFLDEDGSPYTFTCKVSSYWKNEPITIGDESQKTITLENENKCVFRINVRRIKQEFDETYRYLFAYIAVIDDDGRTHKHRLPQNIRELFKDQ